MFDELFLQVAQEINSEAKFQNDFLHELVFSLPFLINSVYSCKLSSAVLLFFSRTLRYYFLVALGYVLAIIDR